MTRSESWIRERLSRGWNSPTLTTWGSVAVRMASVVVLLPLVLARFNAPEVAVWQLYSLLFALAMLMDFGLAPTFARLLAYARGGASLADMARPDTAHRKASGVERERSVAAVLAAQRWLYLRIAVGVAVVLGVFGSWALQRPISLTADPAAAWTGWLLVLCTLGIGFWEAAMARPCRAWNASPFCAAGRSAAAWRRCSTSTLAVLLAGGGLLANWWPATSSGWCSTRCATGRLMKRQCIPS